MPFYNSRPVKAPALHTMPVKQMKAILAMRARWRESNTPAKPDWASNEVQQRAAFLTLREQRA